jgi:hypothetical protein
MEMMDIAEEELTKLQLQRFSIDLPSGCKK